MSLRNKPKLINAEVRQAFKAALDRDYMGFVKQNGYRAISLKVEGKWSQFLFHRLVFACHYGLDPGDFQVDHINTQRDDNRIENLRLATGSQNGHNAKLRHDSKTGIKNVSEHRISEGLYCWRAQIRVNNKYYRKHFPHTWDGFLAAVSAAEELRNKHHGKFGRVE